MGVSDAFLPSPKLTKTKHTFSKKRKATTERKRVIRFDDSEITIEYSPCRHPCEKSLLWWTKEERRDILENNRDLAQDFRNFHREQVEHCNDVFDLCCSDVDMSKHAKIQLPALPVSVRGLEYCILPATKRYRKIHVREVLKVQEEYSDDEEKEEALSSRATQSSRPSRVMARILGESDAAATKESTLLRRRNRCRMLPTWW